MVAQPPPPVSLTIFFFLQLVTLVWAHAKLEAKPPETTLDGWRASVLASHSERMMQVTTY